MNVINEYRVEVELAPTEMEDLGVSFETLDWADIETRRAVWSVLGALREYGVALDLSGKVLIEADRGPGGVRLRFSVIPPKGPPFSAKSFVRNENALLLCSGNREDARKAARFFPEAQKRLYRSGGNYWLLVSGPRTPLALRMAGEYCEPVRLSAVAAAYLNEHFAPVTL